MLGQLRDVDVVVVWKLDRLSRSLKDLLLVLEKIDQAGAHFQSLTEAIDTSNSAGRMMMHLVGSFAEFERSLLRERTRVGLDEARKAGRVGGRRPKLTQAQQQEVIELVTSGRKTGADAARLFRVHPATITRVMARHFATLADTAPPIDQAPKAKKPVAKKKTGRAVKKSAAPRKKKSSGVALDAIGLARPVGYEDWEAAVQIGAEREQTKDGEHWDWNTTLHPLNTSIAVAETYVNDFKKKHATARIEQRYVYEHQRVLEIYAHYDADTPDHRLTLSARVAAKRAVKNTRSKTALSKTAK